MLDCERHSRNCWNEWLQPHSCLCCISGANASHCVCWDARFTAWLLSWSHILRNEKFQDERVQEQWVSVYHNVCNCVQFSLCWGFQSTGMWCCIIVWKVPSGLKDYVALIIIGVRYLGMADQSYHTPFSHAAILLELFDPEDGGTVILWNTEYCAPNNRVSHPRGLKSWTKPVWRPVSQVSAMSSLELWFLTCHDISFAFYLCIMHMHTLQVTTKGRNSYSTTAGFVQLYTCNLYLKCELILALDMSVGE